MKTSLQAMPDNVKERVVAFLSGNVFITGFTILKMPVELEGIGWRIFVTILIGVFGGVAGLAGKDIYTSLKRKFIFKKVKKSQQ